ncbi:hypothetical protein GEOBRER4_n0863 [Citrifermentans bremense]|uniref:Outer membrane protein beta-barrel domain-containing protein n=1 Tax=Citrifermentans bremense TaxID=60035 RepID=A0A7R7IZ33_9BACT|nr:hypothetical protein GEOBRER4_n0863 [Citrifermentans bremense]
MCLRHVRLFVLGLMLLTVCAPLQAVAGGLQQLSSPIETPKLSQPMTSLDLFDTGNFLTHAGVKFSAAEKVSLEPELGVGYSSREQEFHGGVEQSTHRVHAQAGWRLSLADSFYLSAAAKLPVMTVEKKGLTGGAELGIRPDVDTRTGYDFIAPSRSSVRWTGEVGIRLLPRADLMLYYDQNPLDGWSFTDQHQEERIGTRFIIRFE